MIYVPTMNPFAAFGFAVAWLFSGGKIGRLPIGWEREPRPASGESLGDALEQWSGNLVDVDGRDVFVGSYGQMTALRQHARREGLDGSAMALYREAAFQQPQHELDAQRMSERWKARTPDEYVAWHQLR